MAIEQDVVTIRSPRNLGVDQIPVERLPLGKRGTYKPCIARLPDGELLLIAYRRDFTITGPEDQIHYDTLLFRSRDGGKSWPEEQVLRGMSIAEPYLSVMRDGTILMTAGIPANERDNPRDYSCPILYRSTDGARTWEETEIGIEDALGAADKNITGISRNVLELQDGSLIFGVGVGAPDVREYLWRSNDKGKTWDKTLRCKYDGVDEAQCRFPILIEAHYWQAARGDLLAICRVESKVFPPLPGTQIPQTESDHYERMVLYRSEDGGRNWSFGELGSYYGEMYPSVLRMQDGRLLLTFTVRAAVPPSVPPLGVQAVIGEETEDGFRFDFEHDRIMLDTKTPIGQYSGGGFGPTVQLDDGTLVTSYSYGGPEDWPTDFHTEVVRWRLP